MRPLGALLAFVLTAALPAKADEALIGRWTGDFECQGQPRGKLTIDFPTEGAGQAGTVWFSIRGLEGSYQVALVPRPDGFDLVHDGWIKRPPGANAENGLTGALGPDGTTITGEVAACRRSRFEVTRATPAVPAAPLGAPETKVAESSSPLSPEPALPPAPEGLAGRWTGVFMCNSGPIAMTLLLEDRGEGLLQGWMEYEAGGKTYRYLLTGSGKADHYNLGPYDPPASWDLSLRRSASGRTLSGEIKGDCMRGPVRALREELASAPDPDVEGTTPRVDIGVMGGLLRGAKSAEGQCHVLETWANRHAGELDNARADPKLIAQQIAGAFTDDLLEPLLGLAMAEVSMGVLANIGGILYATCGRQFGHDGTGQKLGAALQQSKVQQALAKAVQRREGSGLQVQILDWRELTDPAEWLKEGEAVIEAFKDGLPDSLEHARQLERALFARAPWGTPRSEVERLVAAYDAVRAAARADAMIVAMTTDLGKLDPGGGLGTALYHADRALASDLPRSEAGRVVEAARTVARKVLAPRLQTAAALASDLPQSLDGLMAGRDALLPLEQYLGSMQRTFGGLDPDGTLRPLYDRLAALHDDPAIMAAMSEALMAAADGPDPVAAVAAIAQRVTSLDPGANDPRARALIVAAWDRAEANAVVVEDRSGTGPGEPTAQDIRDFALSRVRAVNRAAEIMSQACPADGVIDDPLILVLCGAGIVSEFRLLRVVKLGCAPEADDGGFLCVFEQEIDGALSRFPSRSQVLFTRQGDGWVAEGVPAE